MKADEMQAGRELDALIAEKVMGWERVQNGCDSPTWKDAENNLHTWETTSYGGFHPSSDIGDAWRVVEHFRDARINVAINPGVHFPWFCSIRYPFEEENAGDSFTETAPLAICRAALKAVGSD